MLVLHSKHPHNRVTVVGEFVENELVLAASRCGNQDNFSRKLGRSKAMGRLLMKHPKQCVECDIIVKKDYRHRIPVGSNQTTNVFVEHAAELADRVHYKSSNVFKIVA